MSIHPSYRHRYATFWSPGTFFPESTTIEVGLDESLASIAKRAHKVSERYGAKPHSFTLEVIDEKEVTSNGETYKAAPKTVSKSGFYFITGRVLMLADVPDTEENSILRDNMRANGFVCVENTNSYRFTGAFRKDDVIIDWDGNVLARGADYYNPKTGKPL